MNPRTADDGAVPPSGRRYCWRWCAHIDVMERSSTSAIAFDELDTMGPVDPSVDLAAPNHDRCAVTLNIASSRRKSATDPTEPIAQQRLVDAGA